MATTDKIYDSPEMLFARESGILEPIHVDKPWGWEKLLVLNPKYCMKILHVREGQRLSIQYHERKMETLYCISGKGIALLGVREDDLDEHDLAPGSLIHISPRTIHAFEATEDLTLVEASTPEVDDVVRLSDRYGRR